MDYLISTSIIFLAQDFSESSSSVDEDVCILFIENESTQKLHLRHWRRLFRWAVKSVKKYIQIKNYVFII